MKREAIISKNWLINFRKLLLPPEGTDIPVLLVVLAMVGFGLLMVYSSSFIYAQERTGDGFAFIKKQLLFAGMGIAGLLAVSRLSCQRLYNWAFPIMVAAIAVLAFVMIPGIGSRVGGAQRWIKFGFFSFQPAELVKFAIIVFVARQISMKWDLISSNYKALMSVVLLPLPALVLLLAQPDFGTTVIICITIFILLFLSGAPKKTLGLVAVISIITAAILAFGTPYRRARVMTFLDPWTDPSGKGFQIIQSLIGLNNGKFWGVGLGNGKEKLFYLPEAHNDFIFAVIGEELGFIGLTVVALVFAFFIYRGLRIGWKALYEHNDRFGFVLACGITLVLGLQGFVNMAVVLGLVPTKGLTLPFISYGGSALLVDLLAVGVLISIGRGQKVKLEQENKQETGS